MTVEIHSLLDLESRYDAIVLDQWGVLHNGSRPYAGASQCLGSLADRGQCVAVLSNSGKRADPNLQRLVDLGFSEDHFSLVMTSGEALWLDISNRKVPEERFFAVERTVGDAEDWAAGLDLELVSDIDQADAVLLMGLPDGTTIDAWLPVLNKAGDRQLKLYCSNPDIASPRADGLVVSPGALAHRYEQNGGQVVYYGKPHRPVFDTLQSLLGARDMLMVGDSLHHDIAGAHAAGWDSVLVLGGLLADKFENGHAEDKLESLLAEENCPAPTYTIGLLQ
ncbi:MAG: TIGR01459 family HAD-type hydrolase [Pseudomonadota bacterium]